MKAIRYLQEIIGTRAFLAAALTIAILFFFGFSAGTFVWCSQLAAVADQFNQRLDDVEGTHASVIRAYERELREAKGLPVNDINPEAALPETALPDDPEPVPAIADPAERQVVLLKYTKSRAEADKWKEDYGGTFEPCSLPGAGELKLCVKPVRDGEIYAALLVADGLGSKEGEKVVTCLRGSTFKNVKPQPETRPATKFASPDCL